MLRVMIVVFTQLSLVVRLYVQCTVKVNGCFKTYRKPCMYMYVLNKYASDSIEGPGVYPAYSMLNFVLFVIFAQICLIFDM